MSSNSNNTMSSNSDNTQRPLTDLEAIVLARVDAHLRLLSMEPPQPSPMDPRQQPAAPRPTDEHHQQAPNQQHHRQQSRNPDNQQSRGAQQPRATDLSTATPQTRLVLVDEELFEVLYQHALEGIYPPEDMAIWQQIQELADNTYGPEINTSYNGPDHDYLNQLAAADYLQNEERYCEIQQFWIDQHEIVDEDDYGYFSA
ncbi:hypothetical protein BOTNAR_1993g00010 [Botryotinia narcissicola]|uniref:Uncharacterized protein n=1 Tax=Botryotinia narcissicola TaxID=278944 RepID=A0A4Z1H7Z9_9HELO|nr:hypothetical protein BOTNAR_1993g00010 [Botryotinia narcissicola]